MDLGIYEDLIADLFLWSSFFIEKEYKRFFVYNVFELLCKGASFKILSHAEVLVYDRNDMIFISYRA